MKFQWCSLSLLLGSMPTASAIYFGTNLVQPGKVIQFSAPLNASATWEAGRARKVVHSVSGAFVVPTGVTNLSKPCPLLIVSVPSGGSAIAGMRGLTNVALSEGWAVFAADGPKLPVNEDTVQWGVAMLSSALDQFTRTWPQTKQWPVACGGFSGGAKRSAAVGAAMMRDRWRVVGIFMGGCNEDRATLGLQLFQPGAGYLRVPMFLSNGTQDPIANAGHAAAVRDSMTRSGFANIRLESFNGAHQLDSQHLRTALRWFKQNAGLGPR